MTHPLTCTPTHQEVDVKLEVTGELEHQLMDTVQPLEEHRGTLVAVGTGSRLATTVVKPVTKPEPLPLHQHLKALGIERDKKRGAGSGTHTPRVSFGGAIAIIPI